MLRFDVCMLPCSWVHNGGKGDDNHEDNNNDVLRTFDYNHIM